MCYADRFRNLMWNYPVTTFKDLVVLYETILTSTQSVGNYTKPALLHCRKVLPGERYKETLVKTSRGLLPTH